MERIVYLLGAGFSRPFGLPLIGDFLYKAKAMYSSNRERYSDLKPAFKQIDGLARIKNYYQSDQFNIEELLSILSLSNDLRGKGMADTLKSLIMETIRYYTPKLAPYSGTIPSNWYDIWFGYSPPWNAYGTFVASLAGLRVINSNDRLEIIQAGHKEHHYSVITLNYDMLLETISDHILSIANVNPDLGGLERTENTLIGSVPFSKLHGSIDKGNIIPPTWSKTVEKGILASWRRAKWMLERATQIRIVGYSLPDGDANIRFLLKAAMIKSSNVKQIDILCLDENGGVARRMRDFIAFRDMRISNVSVERYLGDCLARTSQAGNTPTRKPLYYNKMEEAHAVLFG